MLRSWTVYAFGFCVLTLAGCGNGEDSEYVDDVNSLREAYIEDIRELTESPSSSAEALAEASPEVAERTSSLAADLEGVDAPADVADLHQELVAEYTDLANQIERLHEQPLSARAEVGRAVRKSEAEVQSLVDEINEHLNE